MELWEIAKAAKNPAAQLVFFELDKGNHQELYIFPSEYEAEQCRYRHLTGVWWRVTDSMRIALLCEFFESVYDNVEASGSFEVGRSYGIALVTYKLLGKPKYLYKYFEMVTSEDYSDSCYDD
jgi:hypothetical protein